MTQEDLRRLFEHMWWADERVLQALVSLASPPVHALRLYTHTLAAELVWIDRVLGNPVTVPVWPEPDLAACQVMARRARESYATFLGQSASISLAETIQYTTSAGQAFETRIDDILLQVALHGAYHRGQIALLLRNSGEDPPVTDYVIFAREVAAAGNAQKDV